MPYRARLPVAPIFLWLILFLYEQVPFPMTIYTNFLCFHKPRHNFKHNVICLEGFFFFQYDHVLLYVCKLFYLYKQNLKPLCSLAHGVLSAGSGPGMHDRLQDQKAKFGSIVLCLELFIPFSILRWKYMPRHSALYIVSLSLSHQTRPK